MEYGNTSNDGRYKMFRLRDLKNGLFQIHSSKHTPAYEGTPRSVFATAIKMGVHEQDLVKAVNHLVQVGDDYADFDYYGRLLKTAKGRPRQ